jgi:hypothetical protein
VRGPSGNWNNDVIGNQNPATNTGGFPCAGVFTSGTIYAAVFLGNTSVSQTINLGSSAFANTIPAGFVSPLTASGGGTPARSGVVIIGDLEFQPDDLAKRTTADIEDSIVQLIALAQLYK